VATFHNQKEHLMSIEAILSPEQFARLCAFIGYAPDETAAALGGEPFGLAPGESARLSAEAYQERGEIDAREEREFDELAVESEWDLDANHFSEPASPRQHTPQLEQTVRAAFRAALSLRQTGWELDALCAFVHGAFDLDVVLACDVAIAVVEEYPVIEEDAA
jgi:hypothetical protein